jgi:DNA-binding IclR family transcriptional regulator
VSTAVPTGMIQSADRALRVLEAVGSAPAGLTARQVADRLGFALPTTYHLLATLVHAGYVVHLADQHRYALGFMVRALDAALRRQVALVPAVGTALRQAHQAADAPIYLALFRDREIVIADVVDSPRRPRVHQLDVGLHESPHATAFGKVMLAALDKQVRDAELARRGLPALTRSSVTDARRLDEQLAKVRREGLAVEVDEFIPKLACVASPVRRADGLVIGAVSASVPSAEFPRRRARLERAVRHGAGQVTRVMARSRR